MVLAMNRGGIRGRRDWHAHTELVRAACKDTITEGEPSLGTRNDSKLEGEDRQGWIED
jgi:hypothetical protein